MKLCDISRITTSRYTPRSNGEIERRWRTIHRYISKHSKTWNDTLEILPKAVFAINNTPNATTKQVPSYLMYMFLPKTPTLYTDFKPRDLKGTQVRAYENEKEKLRLTQ